MQVIVISSRNVLMKRKTIQVEDSYSDSKIFFDKDYMLVILWHALK